MSTMGIGLQLFSVRTQLESDFVGTLEKVAKAGYEGVEFASNFGGMPAVELRELLSKLGLQVIGNHPGLPRLRDDLAEVVQYHKDLGAPYAVAPWVPEEDRTAEKLPELAALLDKSGEAFAKSGIQFGYHNHDFEFLTDVDGKFFFDALFASTSAAKVKVELDVGWVYHAGQDPLAYMEKYASRLPLVHLKDFAHDASGKWVSSPVGKGEVPTAKVISKAAEVGVKWLIVEQDFTQGDIFEDIEFTRGWLKETYR